VVYFVQAGLYVTLLYVTLLYVTRNFEFFSDFLFCQVRCEAPPLLS